MPTNIDAASCMQVLPASILRNRLELINYQPALAGSRLKLWRFPVSKVSAFATPVWTKSPIETKSLAVADLDF
jgi:hypothetical protein